MEKLSNLVSLLVVTQSQSPPPPRPSTQTQITISAILVSTVLASTPHRTMPKGSPWGIPFNFSKGFRPYASEVPFPTTQYAVPVPQPGLMFP